ncbi:hypothetical protein BCF11_3275 [Collimonas sp. PA-H2]|nr:hypothetical protein BCF11_3275 [Collimonas sp. PA-H2]
MNKANQDISVKLRDRVTFDTDEGIQAGYVNDLRRDLGNGELHAWVEVDHQLPGCFRAVPVSAILTSDPVGAPSIIDFCVNWSMQVLAASEPAMCE